MRLNKGAAYTVDTLPKYLQASGGVEGALSTIYNIGVINEAQMEVRDLVNGATVLASQTGPVQLESMVTFPNPANPNLYIELRLPEHAAGTPADIVICDLRGAVVRQFHQPLLGILTRVAWDGRDGTGRQVAAGRYMIQARVGVRKFTEMATLTR
jgi:hypothetical protein